MDTAQFFKTLYQGLPHGYIEIRLIHEAKHFIKRLWKPLPLLDVNPEGLAKLADLNTEYHVYHRIGVSMNQAARKSDIIMLPALYMDVDDCSTETYNRLLDMDLYPNIIVHSGGGFHAYWLLIHPVTTDSERAYTEIERTLEGMVLAFGGNADAKVKDITRILRTPGFYNIKDKYQEKPLTRVVFYDEARYTFDLLHRTFAPLGAAPQAKILRHIPQEAYSRNLPDRVKSYLQSGSSRGNRNHELYYCARAYLDAGYSQMDASNDLSPRARMDGLQDSEIAATIASAYRNTPNPTTAIPAHMRTFMAVEDTAGGA